MGPESALPTPALVVAGCVLLLAGRRFVWLSLGLAGFFAGWLTAARLFPAAGAVGGWLAALAVGLLCAAGALLLPRFAAALAGFAAGGLGTLEAAARFGWGSGTAAWALALVAGVIGALLALLLLELALVVASSLAGAALIVCPLRLTRPLPLVVFSLLTAAGILVQATNRRRRRGRR